MSFPPGSSFAVALQDARVARSLAMDFGKIAIPCPSVFFLVFQNIIEVWLVRRVPANPVAFHLRRDTLLFRGLEVGLVCLIHTLAQNLNIFVRALARIDFLHVCAVYFFPFIHGHRLVGNEQHFPQTSQSVISAKLSNTLPYLQQSRTKMQPSPILPLE